MSNPKSQIQREERTKLQIPEDESPKNNSRLLVLGSWFLFVFLLGCSQKTKTDQEKERELIVSNNIKSITEYVINMRFGAEEKEQINHVRLFNTEGLLVKETLFLSDGSMDFFAIHEYDKNDNLILTKAMRPDSSFFYKETKTYDENNNMKDKVYFEESDGPYFYKKSAVYDSKDRMIEYYWWWPTGLRAKEEYGYDGNKMIKHVEYNPEGKMTYNWTYKYDKMENLIESVQYYYPDSIINSKTIYEYNMYNQVTKQTNYSKESIQKIIKFEYDKKHLLVAKTEYSSSGKISAIYRYQYE